MVDIMVKEEDASRINRIVERFKFASVTEAAQIKTEIQRTKSEKSQGDKSVDELLGAPLKKRRYKQKPLYGKDREIPSVRAYLRKAKQNRRGYF